MTDQQDSKSDTEPAQQERDEQSPVVGRFREAWMKSVGAWATDDGETRNLFKRLVSFGALTTEEAKKLLSETQDRIELNRKELNHRVDESIKTATARMTIPSQGQLESLAARIEALEARVGRLRKRDP